MYTACGLVLAAFVIDLKSLRVVTHIRTVYTFMYALRKKKLGFSFSVCPIVTVRVHRLGFRWSTHIISIRFKKIIKYASDSEQSEGFILFVMVLQ